MPIFYWYLVYEPHTGDILTLGYSNAEPQRKNMGNTCIKMKHEDGDFVVHFNEEIALDNEPIQPTPENRKARAILLDIENQL